MILVSFWEIHRTDGIHKDNYLLYDCQRSSLIVRAYFIQFNQWLWLEFIKEWWKKNTVPFSLLADKIHPPHFIRREQLLTKDICHPLRMGVWIYRISYKAHGRPERHAIPRRFWKSNLGLIMVTMNSYIKNAWRYW